MERFRLAFQHFLLAIGEKGGVMAILQERPFFVGYSMGYPNFLQKKGVH